MQASSLQLQSRDPPEIGMGLGWCTFATATKVSDCEICEDGECWNAVIPRADENTGGHWTETLDHLTKKKLLKRLSESIDFECRFISCIEFRACIDKRVTKDKTRMSMKSLLDDIVRLID